MAFKHPLLQRAQRYPVRKGNLSPEGCDYDRTVGAWRCLTTGSLWADLTDQDRPRTKKNDIETGEDQKGT